MLFALCALGDVMGAALALVTLGVLRLFDRLANHIIVLVASIILGACGILLAAVALTNAGATAADAPAAVNHELGVGLGRHLVAMLRENGLASAAAGS